MMVPAITLGRPRVAIAVAAVVVVVVVVAVMVFVLASGTAAAPTFTAKVAEQLSGDATSGDPDRVTRAVALPPGQQADQSVVARLAAIRLRLDDTTFGAGADGIPAVEGTLADRQGYVRSALFRLVVVDGRWLMADVSSWLEPTAELTPAWLYQAFSGSSGPTGPTGTRRSATVNGHTSDTSTSFWVGCGSTPVVTTFTLNGHQQYLSGLFLLDSPTPVGLVVRVVLKLDGKQVDTWDYRLGETRPIGLETSGAKSLALEAWAVAGGCGSSSIGYGIALNAAVYG
jgi:hypothetical protein